MSDLLLDTRTLFSDNRYRLRLKWPNTTPGRLTLEEGSELEVSIWNPELPPQPHRVLVINAEQWQTLNAAPSPYSGQELLQTPPFLVVFADDINPSEELLQRFAQARLPLFLSPLPAERVLHELRFFQRSLRGDSEVLHGVFMEVHGVGMLLTGESGVGKSELALALISRGHRFIADDTPEFWRDGGAVSGACPALLQDFIEVRGLGFLDIRSLFGDSAIKLRKNLQLIIHLERMAPERLHSLDRALDRLAQQQVCGLKIPSITLPVTAGQQLAVLVETAVRVHIQRRHGYDSNRCFAARQRLMLEG